MNGRLAARLQALAFLFLPLTAGAQTEATRVTVKPLAEVWIHPQQSAPATVLSLNRSRLSAQLDARIEAIPVRVGERVARGETLVRLDCRDYRLAAARAGARHELARQQFARARSLHAQANVSEELLDQRRAEHAEAEADLRQARLAVERCALRAPFDGVVLARLAAEGDLAAPGTPLVEFLDSRRLEVSAQVPMDAVAGLARADQVWFQSGGRRHPLRLRAMTPALDPAARNREVRYEFMRRRPLPGSAGRLVWQAPQAHVPADLLVRRDGSLGLLLVEDGRARFLALPGALEGHPAPAALAPETRVIVQGRHSVSDGDPVRTDD